MLEEFTFKEMFNGSGFWSNKWAVQLGARGSELLNIRNLSYLVEYNAARPYTYSHFQRITSYSGMGQPLAHPLGANFKEILGILNYSFGRFDFQGEISRSAYGQDPSGMNYGGNIFLDYRTRSSDYGNKIGQGISTKLMYIEAKAAFLLNPKNNLRLELSYVHRNEHSIAIKDHTNIINFGLRSSFRNLYQDF